MSAAYLSPSPQAVYYAPGTIGVSSVVRGWVRPHNPGVSYLFSSGGHRNPIHAARSVQIVPVRWGRSRGVLAFSIAAG